MKICTWGLLGMLNPNLAGIKLANQWFLLKNAIQDDRSLYFEEKLTFELKHLKSCVNELFLGNSTMRNLILTLFLRFDIILT